MFLSKISMHSCITIIYIGGKIFLSLLFKTFWYKRNIKLKRHIKDCFKINDKQIIYIYINYIIHCKIKRDNDQVPKIVRVPRNKTNPKKRKIKIYK